MTGRSAASHHTKNTSSTFSDDNVNPFESSRFYSSDDSATTLPKPAPVVHPASRHQRMASVNAAHNDEILGVEQGQTIDEKRWSAAHQQRQSSVDRSHHSYDPEKAAYTRPARHTNDADGDSLLSNLDGLQAQNALRILLYLSGPCVLLSFVTAFWALFALLITILYQPLRLCTPRLAFKHQLCHLLAPTLNLHLRSIYAKVYARPVDGDELYCGVWLLVVHFIAPILSLGNAIAAWVVAVYWGLARIVGDPSGIDKKDDGVEAVLGLTRWWEHLLVRAVKTK